MSVFDGVYDSYLALSLYQSYSNGSRTGDVLNELLKQIGPLVAIVSKKELGPNSMGALNVEELRLDALLRVYEVFEGGNIDTDDPREFTAYLWTTMRRAMLRTINNESRLWDLVTPEVDINDNGVACKELWKAETRLYVRSINKLILSVFNADLRLQGREREACIYYAEESIAGNIPSANSLRFRFRLTRSKARFVAGYARCVLKTIEHDVRQVDENLV